MMHEKKDHIVSVRLPAGLVEELRSLQNKNHFLDISDEIRFVIRTYCKTTTGTKESIQEDLIERHRKEKLIQNLSQIILSLQQEQLSSKDAEQSLASSIAQLKNKSIPQKINTHQK